MNIEERKLAKVAPSDRVLLISHCLRNSGACQATYDQQGLQCADCPAQCSIATLRHAALALGYKGVCVAPGGRLAVKYVRETKPRGIVAVACGKELEEGVNAVIGMGADDFEAPPVVIVPLTKDGCVDTEVDETVALAAIRLGCDIATAAPPAGQA